MVDDLVPREDRDLEAHVFGWLAHANLLREIARACKATRTALWSPHDLRHRQMENIVSRGIQVLIPPTRANAKAPGRAGMAAHAFIRRVLQTDRGGRARRHYGTISSGMAESVVSGRPREARIDAAVRDAIRELLAREGYAGTTIERVAAHAGVGRGAVYRRWRSKAEMVFAAVVHSAELPTPVDSGTLESDLVALAERIADLTGTDQARAALAGLVAELAGEPELARVLEAQLFAAERRYLALIVERACARGELGRGADPELVRRLLVGPIVLTPLFAPKAQLCPRDVARVVAAGLLATHPPEVPK